MSQPPLTATHASSIADRPITPFILSLLGGLFIIVGGVFGLLFLPFSFAVADRIPYVAVAVATGIAVLAGTFLLYMRPDQHVMWGVVIVVFSMMSIFSWIAGMFGGFFVGMVLGIVGGCVAIAWTPGMTFGGPPRPVRICTGCGRYVTFGYPYCPFCGTAAPVWQPPGATAQARPPTGPS